MQSNNKGGIHSSGSTCNGGGALARRNRRNGHNFENGSIVAAQSNCVNSPNAAAVAATTDSGVDIDIDIGILIPNETFKKPIPFHSNVTRQSNIRNVHKNRNRNMNVNMDRSTMMNAIGQDKNKHWDGILSICYYNIIQRQLQTFQSPSPPTANGNRNKNEHVRWATFVAQCDAHAWTNMDKVMKIYEDD